MRVKQKNAPKYVIFIFSLCALMLLLCVIIGVSAYRNSSAIISDRALLKALSEHFDKAPRDITVADLTTIRAIRITENTISFGTEDVVAGQEKNYKLDTEDWPTSWIQVDSLYKTVQYPEPITDFSLVGLFPDLYSLTVQDCPAFTDASVLARYKNLYELKLIGCDGALKNLDFLQGMERLGALTLSGVGVQDFSEINRHPTLVQLDLSNNGLTEMPKLSELKSLKVLALSGNNLAEAEGLKELSNLQYLDLCENDVSDLGELPELEDLSFLYVEGNEKLEENLDVLETLEGVEIDVLIAAETENETEEEKDTETEDTETEDTEETKETEAKGSSNG